jgi:hypothetical protein
LSHHVAALQLVALVLLTSSPASAAPHPASVKELLAAVTKQPDFSDYEMRVSRKIKLAVELGESALPALSSLLAKATSDEEHQNVGNVIAYIGGSTAVQILQMDALRSPSVISKSALALAAPSNPSKEVVALLVGYLDGPQLGDSWFPIVQSAYSLGIVRESAAVPSLLAVVDQRGAYSTFASSAAQDALDWINGPDVTIKFVVSSSNDDLIRAIVASGLPTITRRSSWCEHSTQRRGWRKTQRDWIVDAGCALDFDKAQIYLEAYRSSDGMRAVVAVGFHLSPKDGKGYNYILRRYGDQWKVIGLRPTWVS